jgi:hypothetical protein
MATDWGLGEIMDTTRRALLLGAAAAAGAAHAIPAEAQFDGWTANEEPLSGRVDATRFTGTSDTAGIGGRLPAGRYRLSSLLKPLDGNPLDRDGLIAEGFDLVDVECGYTRITKTFDRPTSGECFIKLPSGSHANITIVQVDDVYCATTAAALPPKPARSGFDWRAEQRNKHKRVRA